MKVDVLIIIPSFYPALIYGGPIVSTYKTCEALNVIDVKFAVCTTNANGYNRLSVNKNKFINELGFLVKYYNETIIGKFSFRLLFNLWVDILNARVIHVQSIFSTPAPIALIYSWLFNKNVVLSPRGSLGEWCLNNKNIKKNFWLKLFIKPFLRKTTWHATSEQEKSEIVSLFGEQKISIIPNGIDLDFFFKHEYNKDYFTEKYNLSSSTRVIISMGRLEKKKGFDILINSIKYIVDNGYDARLFIAGPDYGELQHLEVLSKSLDIADKVTFVGNITGKEKCDFLGAADVFAMPSHNENFGNVYAESLACGTPIVASKQTPWKDIEKYNCGRWVENNHIETANAIVDLLNKDLSVLNRNCIHYISGFGWDVVASDFKKLYQRLM